MGSRQPVNGGRMKLQTRIAALESRAGARLERIRLVGMNPDGREGEGAILKIPPVGPDGKFDVSGLTRSELHALARIPLDSD